MDLPCIPTTGNFLLEPKRLWMEHTIMRSMWVKQKYYPGLYNLNRLHNSLQRWVYIDDGLMDVSCCLLHSVGICCTAMTAMAWWICHAAYYTRWVYVELANGDTHLYENNSDSCLQPRPQKIAKRYLAYAKQIIRCTVSLATTLEPEKQIWWRETN